jgi:hypothetical protein
MMREGASMRPLVESEVNRPMSMCDCGKSRPLYLIRWIQTKYASRAYSYAGGKDRRVQEQNRVCLQCAMEWGKDNDLKVHPAPAPDPAPGQIWKQVERPHMLVVVTGWDDAEFGREIMFEPSLPNYGRPVGSLQPHGFLRVFDPVLDEVTP